MSLRSLEGIMEKGKLSIHTENILPVIKKWLYSEKEIFLRELVSNAFDAIMKLKKISLSEEIHESENQDFKLEIKIDRENGILEFSDNGIGMSAEEIKKYITQIAFSGAEDFIKKYEQSEGRGGIIGNFGLGFYSSFMVAKKVEIETRSYRPGEKAALWSGDGGEEYEIGESGRENRGTTIRLFLDDESKETLDRAKVSELVRKYCDFLPVPIHVDGAQVNRQNPLWSRPPASITKEEYNEFYRYLFPFQGDPLFYVHLNVDYPFRLQGILYFPRLAHELDINRSNVKIYCKQVFVTDEAQELIPKFLTALQGVVDLPDLPLNVSRSYIQNEPQIKKISAHIIKKVGDRLSEELKSDRAEYEKIWNEIAPFVKYGMLSDERFYDQAKDSLLFEVALAEPKKFVTLDEYIQENKPKTGEKIYYASDLRSQSGPLGMLKNQGIQSLLLNTMIDTHFVHFLETKVKEKFARVDAEISEHILDTTGDSILLDADGANRADRIGEIFKNALSNSKITVRAEALKDPGIPAMILLSEQTRRFSEMSAFMGREAPAFPEEHTLVVNIKNPLVQSIAKPHIIAEGSTGKSEKIARQVYFLARLAQGGVSPQEMEKYVSESYEFLAGIA